MRKVSEIRDFFVAIKKEAPSELPLSLFIIIIQLPQVAYLIDIQIFSSFCVDRKKKQERTANTLRRRTNGLFGVWLRNSRLRRSDSPRPRRHRKASFVTDGSRYRSPSQHPATCRGRLAKRKSKPILIRKSALKMLILSPGGL